MGVAGDTVATPQDLGRFWCQNPDIGIPISLPATPAKKTPPGRGGVSYRPTSRSGSR